MTTPEDAGGSGQAHWMQIDPATFLRRFLLRLETVHRHCLRTIGAARKPPEPAPGPNAMLMQMSFIQGLEDRLPTTQETDEWLAGCTLRDSSEFLVTLCDEVQKLMTLVPKVAGGHKITRAIKDQQDFEDYLDDLAGKDASDFEKKPLNQKLDILEVALGGAVPLRAEIESINRLRRCLVHRLGVVAKKDAVDDGATSLRVRFHAMELGIQEGTDGPIAPLEIGKVYEKGARSTSLWHRQRRWSLPAARGWY
jgi:hypothetical protein